MAEKKRARKSKQVSTRPKGFTDEEREALGFSDQSTLDEGNMWPTAFALKQLTAADEARIRELVKKAAS